MYAVFGGFVSISGGCMLLSKELIIIDEDSPHITMQHLATF